MVELALLLRSRVFYASCAFSAISHTGLRSTISNLVTNNRLPVLIVLCYELQVICRPIVFDVPIVSHFIAYISNPCLFCTFCSIRSSDEHRSASRVMRIIERSTGRFQWINQIILWYLKQSMLVFAIKVEYSAKFSLRLKSHRVPMWIHTADHFSKLICSIKCVFRWTWFALRFITVRKK